MAERARIARYFVPLTYGESGSFSLSDDAALLTPPVGSSLVVTTDSVIEAIHLPSGATPQQFAQKLMRRNLSDLAAMGAMPWRYTLNLHTPTGLPEEWFAHFSKTLHSEQAQFGLILAGGDSTASANAAIHATMTCFGLTDGPVLRRNGAQVGDDLYVSGTIGDAAWALHQLQQKRPTTLGTRYYAPEPRLALGLALRTIATATIDISDGLIADFAQLCSTSDVGAEVTQATIPLSREVEKALAEDADVLNLILHGGDDYELLFTAPPSERPRLDMLAQALDLPLTRIGKITARKEIMLHDVAGKATPQKAMGWEYV